MIAEGNNKYDDDLDKLDDEEKRQMEREIKAAFEGRLDELDIDNLLLILTFFNKKYYKKYNI